MELREEYKKATGKSPSILMCHVMGATEEYVKWLENKIKAQRVILKAFQQKQPDNTECPGDCMHRKGRHCILISTNHCVRKAEDYYISAIVK